MCGITGFVVDAERPVGGWFAEAVHCVSHRGPDRERIWLAGDTTRSLPDERHDARTTAGFGFARLAIIDLSEASDQPFVAPGRAALTFNGEIYNYIELRDELAGMGWTFSSAGDAEVLLKGYLQWGLDVLPRLNGMFALAIHDEAKGSLLLARDRFGEKPMFWTEWEGGVAFASEAKQLARYPGLRLDLEPAAVDAYLSTGRPYLGFSSWFRGIRQLAPGSWLVRDADGCRTGSYFDLRSEVAAVAPETSPRAWADRFSAAWQRSVELRLRSDVPVGTSLSSGVDSSAVMVEAAAIGHERYHAFTLRYDAERDEGRAAADLAAASGATWHAVWATGEEFAETWDALTWHHETPVATASAFGQWKVFEAAHAAGIRVVLDGQGADEMLAGYHKFYAAHVLHRIRSVGPGAFFDVARFGRQVGLGPLAERATSILRREAHANGSGDRLDGTASPPVISDLRRMRIADIEEWSLPTLLSYADRNAMAHSIETRLPFLDPDVAVLALAMPGEVLFRDGWTKWPLRAHLASRGAPGPAWRRGKRWFDLPSAEWLRGPLRPAIDALADSPHPAWAEFVEPDRLRTLVAHHRDAADPARGGTLMRLLALERFFRVWLPADSAERAYLPDARSRMPASR